MGNGDEAPADDADKKLGFGGGLERPVLVCEGEVMEGRTPPLMAKETHLFRTKG